MKTMRFYVFKFQLMYHDISSIILLKNLSFSNLLMHGRNFLDIFEFFSCIDLLKQADPNE